jgi:RNA polymerase sigma-70 factor, ECF subfamily
MGRTLSVRHHSREAADAPDLADSVRAAQRGDAASFRRVIDASHAQVYRLAVRLLGSTNDAEDVVQDTYVRAWSSLDELRDPAAVVAWLLRIARNLARDRMRWYRRRRAEALDDLSPDIQPRLATPAGRRADELLISAEVRASVQKALHAVAAKHRVVLLLREVDGMSYDEIAATLGIPVGTVESRLHRARKALARKLTSLARKEEVP